MQGFLRRHAHGSDEAIAASILPDILNEKLVYCLNRLRLDSQDDLQ